MRSAKTRQGHDRTRDVGGWLGRVFLADFQQKQWVDKECRDNSASWDGEGTAVGQVVTCPRPRSPRCAR